MPDIIDLLELEEGWRERPYLCSESYPTVGYGFKLGPQIIGPNKKHQCELLYNFTLPKDAGKVWLIELVKSKLEAMYDKPAIEKAIVSCAQPGELYTMNPRVCVLISMAFQMGVEGLAGFKATLKAIAEKDWFMAETYMLKSKWANQTPNRARRHAKQMRTGVWDEAYGSH